MTTSARRALTRQYSCACSSCRTSGNAATADTRNSTIGTSPERFRLGSYMSIELNTATVVPEWNNQKVTVMAEDDAFMTENGFEFFHPRQTEFYIIK